MEKSNKGAEGTNDKSKQPFVSRGDRPEVKIDLDTPVNELRVRDLGAILGFLGSKNPNFEVGKTSIKDFFDKPFPEVVKDWLKELKHEKVEKPEKFEKPEKPEKYEKNEKLEKPEKDTKLEKIENRETVATVGLPGPYPMIEQIIQAVAGLTNQVSQLANQVEKLEKRIEG